MNSIITNAFNLICRSKAYLTINSLSKLLHCHIGRPLLKQQLNHSRQISRELNNPRKLAYKYTATLTGIVTMGETMTSPTANFMGFVTAHAGTFYVLVNFILVAQSQLIIKTNYLNNLLSLY